MQQDVERFIERAGILWEEDGLPRIAGRIFALTLISPEPCSLDALAEALGVSKASVSNDARLLDKMGFLEKVSLPGDRRDYYRITTQSFERSIAERLQRIRKHQDLIESGLRLQIRHADVRERLEDQQLALGVVIDALGDALEQLRAKHRAGGRREGSRRT